MLTIVFEKSKYLNTFAHLLNFVALQIETIFGKLKTGESRIKKHIKTNRQTIVFGVSVLRRGLGVPDGMVKRSPYSITSETDRAANHERI